MADTKNMAGLGTRIYGLLVAAAVLIIVVMVALMLGSSGGAAGPGAPSSLGADVETAVRIAEDPARGVVPDFQALSLRVKSVDDTLAGQGSSSLATDWKALHEPLAAIGAAEAQVKRTASSAAGISAAIPGLSTTYEGLAAKLAGAKGSSPSQLLLAADQLVRLQKIRSIANDVLASGTDAQAAATRLDNETKIFARNIALLAEPTGSAEIQAAGADDLAKKAKTDFAAVQSAVAAIVEDSPAVNKEQQGSAAVTAGGAAVIDAARRLDQSVRSGAAPTESGAPVWLYGALVLALLLLAGFAAVSLGAVRRREKLAEDKEARQQQAILNLLDEITNLANGDLTVDVTVTEDFTGAIADSINYTVQTLRGLVGTINQTSEQIVASAANTQDTAMRMSQASDRQAREIASVTTSVSATSNQMQEVAGRAERLAVQAQTSVQIAHNGAGTVGRTIQSMAALREQIQDTAKRIKRLGESSQEIGNITELINDIAEQTNTLALNASIQAAMAGEQGRGFAVVADEVQRLAERAGSATRQIENLVKTIQADTNEAIISMERSTANVVSGAKSAEEAGQSLTRIEASSQELAQLISEISVSARGQSAEATKIAGTMQGIREIAVQTSGSADRTSKAVGELNSLSDKLRESVAGFKLPEASVA